MMHKPILHGECDPIPEKPKKKRVGKVQPLTIAELARNTVVT
jgi:hypothetical protein